MELPNSQHKLKPILATVLVVFIVAYLGVLTRNELREYRFIGRPDQQVYTITISGEGKVTTKPDIAQVTIGVQTENKNVGIAQQENTQQMSGVLTALDELGIAAEDRKTVNYNIYPLYDYFSDRGQQLRGYQVNQDVNVKIRDLSKVSRVLEIAGQQGANLISGLSFTIDEPEELRQQAREKALANAKEKAEKLADVAGTKLGRLVSFSENSASPIPQPFYADYARAEGYGGGGAAPLVEPGSQEITVYVTVTYEVL